jgi:hypothetical protein
MLTDADKLLIAAAVDGPLPPDQAAAYAHLLAHSAEARALAGRLDADRRGVASLPRWPAPAGLAAAVDARLPIIRLSQPLPETRRPAWLPYVTAAGLLFAAGFAGYQFAGSVPGRQPPVAVKPPARPPLPRVSSEPELAPEPQPAPEPAAVVERVEPKPSEVAPSPRPVAEPTLLAAGLFREIEPPAETVTRLPALGPVGELDSAEVRGRTSATWASAPAARLDLFVPDVLSAVVAVEAAAKSIGWSVSTEAAAQTLIRARQTGTFALYVDSLTGEEAGQFLAALAAQQRDGAKLGIAHLAAAGAVDLRELKELLGEAPKPSRPAADDSTIGQVVKQLSPKRPALLYALTPPAARPPVGSKEVRVFAAGRGERKPGTIPLLVVIRPTDGN